MTHRRFAAAIGSAVLLLGPTAISTHAQDAHEVRFLPYTFAAPGGVSAGDTKTLHVGGGFDALLWRGLGASIEGGYVGPFPDGFDYGLAVISTNAVYHFDPARRHRLTPFVTGGYSVAFRSNVGHGFNFGAGAHYWLSDGFGLRFEVRDHLPIEGGIRDAHLWGVRVGFTWAH